MFVFEKIGLECNCRKIWNFWIFKNVFWCKFIRI